jgi:MATE family multidrug resistance protein
VAFGDFFLMLPYGLSLGVVTLVGSLLGKNDHKGAKITCLITSIFSSICAMVSTLVIVLGRHSLANFYTDNEDVAELAADAFLAFGIAFMFDWIQCQLGGSIKAVGAQGYASISSLMRVTLVSLPVSYYLGV